MTGTPDWVAGLGLQPHPEGGFFRRIYTAGRMCEMDDGAPRPLATAIYYLLDRQEPLGRLHRNRSDILHFLIEGGPIEYLLLTEGGVLERHRLSAQERFLMVPGGCWKASLLIGDATFGLISEVVLPGFDYVDHEFATEKDLRARYAAHWEEMAPFLRREGPRL